MATMTLKIELGALSKVPSGCWETHKRGKNWCAEIHKDPQSPGGLGRKFWEKAKGEYYYMVPSGLKPGAVLEFGADYYTGSGNPQRTRVFAVVSAVAENGLSIETFDTSAQAFKAASIKPEPVADDPKLTAITEINRLMREHGITVEDLAVPAMV